MGLHVMTGHLKVDNMNLKPHINMQIITSLFFFWV